MMVKFAQRLDLPKLHGLIPRSKLCFHALNRHNLVVKLITRFGYAAKRPVADCLYRFIFVHRHQALLYVRLLAL